MQSNSGLRICVASSGLGHVTRGVESWADDLGRTLAERGEQVILCKGSGEVDAPHQRVVPCWTRESKPTRRFLRWLPNAIGWRVGMGSGYGVEQTTFAWRLLRLLRQERIDVLHVQDPQVAILAQKAMQSGLCHAKTVFGHVTEEPVDLLRRIDHLHHVAPWHQQQVAAAGVEKRTWTLIPNFIDTSQFQPGENPKLRQELAIPLDAHVLLVSSAIKRGHKRIDYLIDEVAQVRHRRPELPIYLVIAGGRERETDELVQKGKQVLGDRVRFAIQFPRNRMPELYRMADVLIHGSLFEMFGTVLLEATSSGVPCIVHHHPVMKWVVGPGGLVKDLSVDGALAAALIGLLDDNALRERLGIAARRHCCAMFSRQVVVDQSLQYYQRVVPRKQVAA